MPSEDDIDKWAHWLVDGCADQAREHPIVSHALAMALGYSMHRWRRINRKYNSTPLVPHEAIEAQRWIRARVLRVGDADGVRVVHEPWPLLSRLLSRDTKLKDSISVRLMGIDAPESGHFGAVKQAGSA